MQLGRRADESMTPRKFLACPARISCEEVRSPLNLFELLTVMLVVGAGYLLGSFFGHRYGVVGWIGGAILGVGLAILAYMALRRLVGVKTR